jgi:hypothetical protein
MIAIKAAYRGNYGQTQIVYHRDSYVDSAWISLARLMRVRERLVVCDENGFVPF